MPARPLLPLMASVQAAQGINDEDAIVEALMAMTKVARVIGAKVKVDAT